MAMTTTEKILAAHAGLPEAVPGQLIMARVDLVLGNDITAPVAIREFARMGVERVFDADRVALVPDHFTPNKDISAAEQVRVMRDFARAQGIRHYYEVGRMGVEHCLLPEQGLIAPGELIIGADSHTCTYGALGAFATGVGSTDMAAVMATGEIWLRVPESMLSTFTGRLPKWVGGKDLILHTIGQIGVDGARYAAMEFAGPAISELSVEGRLTMANMAVEAGAKNGIFPVDDKTRAYLENRVNRPYQSEASDPDAAYARRYAWDVTDFVPLVARPHLPEKVAPARELREIRLDQVVIGSCTNGRLEDLRVAAELLRGRQVSRDVRLVVIPGTQDIYLQALREGLIEVFITAGGAVSTPTCGPCLGGHMGILARGERALATTNRNFVGRMGHRESEVYLAGPAVAAASAIFGRIADPGEVAA